MKSLVGLVIVVDLLLLCVLAAAGQHVSPDLHGHGLPTLHSVSRIGAVAGDHIGHATAGVAEALEGLGSAIATGASRVVAAATTSIDGLRSG